MLVINTLLPSLLDNFTWRTLGDTEATPKSPSWTLFHDLPRLGEGAGAANLKFKPS